MKTPRFLFVVGVGSGLAAHPVWPDVHQPFEGETDTDDSWVAWRLTGANHRELGRSARVFPDLAHARADAHRLHRGVTEAQVQIMTVLHTTTWGWRLQLGDVAVATTSRGYARYRDCAYNISAFLAAAAIAELTDGQRLRRRRPVAGDRIAEQVP